MINTLIAETTDYDFKVALETKKPKSWLKSVSAFSNGKGGKLFFGISNNKELIGLTDIQADAETISRLIKERIDPLPGFVLTAEKENGRDLLILTVYPGKSTPYYYKSDGTMTAFIRVGNESIPASRHILNQLILNGMNRTYDSLVTDYNLKDYSFSKLREQYHARTKKSMEDQMFESFGICDGNGKLTNAGAMLADDSPIRHSRIFCTRWNGLDKAGGVIDALDSIEISGSLITQLIEGFSFVRRNMRKGWKKTADSRIELPDYCERSVFEALVNAIIHRDYTVLGSEVHLDIYDDRLTIYSPGGMADGTHIQDREIFNVSSTRRNPVIADIFGRLNFMERQGSGFKKIKDAYSAAYNYKDELAPEFYSEDTLFQVTLYNLNYNSADIASVYINDPENSSMLKIIEQLKIKQIIKDRIKVIYAKTGKDGIVSRSDIAEITNISLASATKLMVILKETGLITPVSGFGKGKYMFINPKESTKE